MKHLTQAQLTGVLDGALTGRTREEAERHLAACATCRNALAALTAQDEALRTAIAHDPGEAYFEGFADRVRDRIAREAAPAPRGRGLAWLDWLRTPRGLAWAGSAAAILIVAGTVLITARETPLSWLRRPDIEARARQVSDPTAAPEAGATRMAEPAPPTAPDAGTSGGAMDDAASSRASNEAAAPQEAAEPAVPSDDGALRAQPPSPARQREVRLDARGQEAPSHDQAFAPSPPPAPAVETDRLVKPGARPLENRLDADAAKKPAEPLRYRAGEEVEKEKQEVAAPKQVAPATGRTEEKAQASTQAAAPAPAPAAPVPVARTLERRDEAATPRLCGEVRDQAGRPVVAAQVALVEVARTTVTDDRGGFCIEAPPGDYTLSVLAVGFEPVRRPATVAAPGVLPAQEEVRLAAVPVLEGMAKTLDAARRGTWGRAGGKTFTDWSPTARALALKAEQQSTRAADARSAAQFDAAAADWERVLERSGGGDGALEARRRIAEARYLAWGLEPTPVRKRAALGALTEFIGRAPAGAARDSAARWLDRVR